MAGRYVGEMQVRVAGDRDSAPAYLPAARLLMGSVLEQAGVNNLGTHLLRQQLDDGAILLAEKVGGINRVTITPPPRGGRNRPVRVFDDIVTTAGVAEWSGGVMAFPPVILSHDADLRWKPYFASSDARGYYEGAGTYKDAFTLAKENADSLRVGNTAYANPDGVVVTWVSSSPFLTEPSRNPNAAFGNTVFCVGKALLYVRDDKAQQVGDYLHVLSAAIDDGQLLVLVANLEPMVFDPRPATPERNYDAWASPIYSDIAHETALFRFKLTVETDVVTFQSYYRTDYESEERLWSGSLVRGYNRWTFDPATKAFVSVQLPENPTLVYRNTSLGDLGPAEPLSSAEQIFRVSSTGLTTSPAGEVVFEAAGLQMRLEMSGAQGDYVVPARRIPALRRSHDATSDTRTYNVVMHADLANDRYVLCKREFVAALDGPSVRYTETCRYSVIDAGVEEEFGDTFTAEARVGDLANYTEAISVYLADVAAAGSGIARLCHSACGHVGGMVMMVLDNPMSTLWHSGYTVYGVRAGAMGYTDISRDIMDEPPEWDFTAYFGIGEDSGPQVDYGLVTVYVNQTATSSEYSLAAHSSVAGSYLTSGDLPALLNGAFDTHMFYLAPLGKPLMTQKRERPA